VLPGSWLGPVRPLVGMRGRLRTAARQAQGAREASLPVRSTGRAAWWDSPVSAVPQPAPQ